MIAELACLNRSLGFVFVVLIGLNLPKLVAASTPKPDIVVAAAGSGNFKTIQEAVNSIPSDNRQRMIIFIKDGWYHEKVRIDPNFVTLRGQSRRGTRIEFAQGADEFTKTPDDLGRAVVNINGNDCVIQNLTIKNTQGKIGPHAFAVYGHGDKTVITDCDVLSQGADTLALWGDRSGSYQARLNIRGSVDFVCPRGWCYMAACSFYEVNPKAHASIWHDGAKDKDMKFVLRNCRFDGVDDFILARHHHDAQLFLLDCRFSRRMRDLAPYRVVYPIAGDKPSENDAKRNRDLDASNVWGERAYFYNCHRDGRDYGWFANNLSSAPGAPSPEQITAAWTFDGKWDPERHDAPAILKLQQKEGETEVTFGENVTVKGKPRLRLRDGGYAEYASGSGGTVLVFSTRVRSERTVAVTGLNLHGGAIVASEASANLRMVEGLPKESNEEVDQGPITHKIRIVLTGDSTVTTNAGWGTGFANCLTRSAECINMARGGRSSKSFIAEGRWKQCLDLKPDYVLIQFGHNDQPGHPDRETDPQTSYRQFMTQYVGDARRAGIKPVLITPMSRRQWGTDGQIHSTLQPYVDVVKQIAVEKQVPLIDLHTETIELYEKLGKEKVNELSPLKDSVTTNSVSAAAITNQVYDGTHLNAKGSEIVGPIVARELARVAPELSPYIRCGASSEPKTDQAPGTDAITPGKTSAAPE